VRNVVPTLTSNKRQGLSLNGRCYAIKDTEFILVPAEGPYVQQWCAQGTILLSTGVPVVGLLQARRESKCGFHVPGVVAEDVVGESESKCVVRPVSCCVVSRVLCFFVPCGEGVRLPFIGQGESESHVCRAI
jgi:hypothetical protein